MELLLERIRKEREYTVGRLSLLKRTDNGTMQQVQKTYICDTLESPWRDVGNGDNYRFHDTAVLAGRYPVVINRHPDPVHVCNSVIYSTSVQGDFRYNIWDS